MVTRPTGEMPMHDWTEYLKFLVALVSVVNPIGAIPIFASLTADSSTRERRRVATRTSLSVGLILLLMLFAGDSILHLFGISVASFRVGGGIIVLLMAISMIQARVSRAKHTQEEGEEAADKASVAVVPLGIPILAGPGAISTVIVYAHHEGVPLHALLLGIGIVLVALVVWLCLRAAPFIGNGLGQTGVNVITRIMGLILAAIAVEFIVHGLIELLPVLGHP